MIRMRVMRCRKGGGVLTCVEDGHEDADADDEPEPLDGGHDRHGTHVAREHHDDCQMCEKRYDENNVPCRTCDMYVVRVFMRIRGCTEE